MRNLNAVFVFAPTEAARLCQAGGDWGFLNIYYQISSNPAFLDCQKRKIKALSRNNLLSHSRRDIEMKAVVLCGGMGTRLREETEYRPKPMVEIGDARFFGTS